MLCVYVYMSLCVPVRLLMSVNIGMHMSSCMCRVQKVPSDDPYIPLA